MIISDRLYVLTSKIDDEYVLLNKQCIISCIKDKPFYANLKNAEKSKIYVLNRLDRLINVFTKFESKKENYSQSEFEIIQDKLSMYKKMKEHGIFIKEIELKIL